MSATRYERLLKWYPDRWRTRYGGELVALMEDTYGEGKVPRSAHFGIVRAGVSERLRALGFGGTERPAGEQVRAGSLLVLVAWSLFVVAGAAFAKMTEHWDAATPRGDRGLPAGAFATVQWAAFAGGAVVLLAAIIAVPAFAESIRKGGWEKVRRPFASAAIVSMSTFLLTAVMVAWAHHGRHLSGNGGLATHLVGTIWALLVIASIGTCTAAAVCASRNIQLSQRLLRLEGLLALLLTLAMVSITGGTVVWALAIASDAPSILWGGGSGLFGMPGPSAEVFTALLLVGGLVISLVGSRRVAGAIRGLRPG